MTVSMCISGQQSTSASSTRDAHLNSSRVTTIYLTYVTPRVISGSVVVLWMYRIYGAGRGRSQDCLLKRLRKIFLKFLVVVFGRQGLCVLIRGQLNRMASFLAFNVYFSWLLWIWLSLPVWSIPGKIHIRNYQHVEWTVKLHLLTYVLARSTSLRHWNHVSVSRKTGPYFSLHDNFCQPLTYLTNSTLNYEEIIELLRHYV